MRRIAIVVSRSVVYVVASLLVLLGIALAALETGWGKNQLRALLVRQVRLVHPVVVVAREEDGRWNLAALLRRQVRQNQRSGPGRSSAAPRESNP